MPKITTLPTHLTTYNVYSEGSKLIGTEAEFECPELEAMTSTVSGPGILGEVDFPNTGHFGSLEATVKFRVADGEAAALLDDGRIGLTLRGDISRRDGATGKQVHQAIRIVMQGINKKFSPGTLKASEGMGTSVTLELLYLKIVIENLTVIELDKLNFVFIVNGVDTLSQIRKNI
jgi:P2 family phage contractile tail tube protein